MVSHTTDSIWSLFSFIFSTILNIKRFKALFDRSQKCWDGIWNWRLENPSPQCVQITSCVCTVYWSNDQWLDNGNIGEVNPMYATLYVLQQVTDFLLTFSCDDLRHCFHLVLEHCIFCSFYFFFLFFTCISVRSAEAETKLLFCFLAAIKCCDVTVQLTKWLFTSPLAVELGDLCGYFTSCDNMHGHVHASRASPRTHAGNMTTALTTRYGSQWEAVLPECVLLSGWCQQGFSLSPSATLITIKVKK